MGADAKDGAMSLATIQCTLQVDKDVCKQCPSCEIYAKVAKHVCCQDITTPNNPAEPGQDQAMSASSKSGSPFDSCFYSDSYIYWELFYKDGSGTDQNICEVKFHEANSASFHYSGTEYNGPPVPLYDVQTKMISDVDRNSKFTISVRTPVKSQGMPGMDTEALGAR